MFALLSSEVGYPLELLREATKAGRHRTIEQQIAYDALAVFVARERDDGKKVNLAALSRLLECGRNTVSTTMKKRGRALIALEETMAEAKRQLDEIEARVDLLFELAGADMGSAAETILQQELEREQAA